MPTTSQKGAIAETAVAHAAVRLGIGVSKPLSDLPYDLVLDTGDRLLRVQCKWASRVGDVVVVRCYASRRTRDGLSVRAYAAHEVDAFAAYCADLDRCYFLPFERVAGQRSIQLRLSASADNQLRGIKWAKDFEFAATLHETAGP